MVSFVVMLILQRPCSGLPMTEVQEFFSHGHWTIGLGKMWKNVELMMMDARMVGRATQDPKERKTEVSRRNLNSKDVHGGSSL